METKKRLFKNLLEDLNKKQDVCDEYKFIGTGNPYSNILIIGKEASIENEVQFKRDIVGNFMDWCNLKDYNSDNIQEKDWLNYSILYPYKGQNLNVLNKKMDNDGTSPTWYKYQKMFNFIFNSPNNKSINFHENSFITEVNSTPARKTVNANTDSISFRKTHILTSDYFRSFPVVIISGVGYFEILEDKNEIENIFKVKFIEKKYADIEKNTQPYWIHKSKDKIVINTYQLSIGIADVLLEAIGKEVAVFLKTLK